MRAEPIDSAFSHKVLVNVGGCSEICIIGSNFFKVGLGHKDYHKY